MDAAAKGILHVSIAFLGPALIQLAYTSAEERFCQARHNVDDDDACSPTEVDLRIFGIRPSSILTVSSVTATAVAAVALPLNGALIDRSSHRKTVGAITAFALVIFKLSKSCCHRRTGLYFGYRKLLQTLRSSYTLQSSLHS